MSVKGIKYIRRIGSISLAVSIILLCGQVKASALFNRISGSDRYSTAAQVAMKNWTTSMNAVLVSGEGYADAVSAAVLAKKLDAPILLTSANQLNSNASTALTLLGVKNVYVIGGNASVSESVRKSLKSKYELIELGGKDRYETNLSVANQLINLGMDPSNVMLVGGEGFSDALSAAPIAASKDSILLLGNNNSKYMKPTIDFIEKNESKVTVVGTKHVINDKIYDEIKACARIDGGSDRFDTNLKVLSSFKEVLNFNTVYIVNASGDGYADALVASALAAKTGSPLVLLNTEGSSQIDNAINYIKGNVKKDFCLNIIGGEGVITDYMVQEIERSFL